MKLMKFFLFVLLLLSLIFSGCTNHKEPSGDNYQIHQYTPPTPYHQTIESETISQFNQVITRYFKCNEGYCNSNWYKFQVKKDYVYKVTLIDNRTDGNYSTIINHKFYRENSNRAFSGSYSGSNIFEVFRSPKDEMVYLKISSYNNVENVNSLSNYGIKIQELPLLSQWQNINWVVKNNTYYSNNIEDVKEVWLKNEENGLEFHFHNWPFTSSWIRTEKSYSNFELQFELEIPCIYSESYIMMSFRAEKTETHADDPKNGYVLKFKGDGISHDRYVEERKISISGAHSYYSSDSTGWLLKDWSSLHVQEGFNKIKISAIDDLITIYVNDKEFFSFYDSSYSAGFVYFLVKDTHLKIKNFTIKEL